MSQEKRRRRFSRTGERATGTTLDDQFHDLFECLSVIWHTHTKNNFLPFQRPASIALLSRSSYIRKFNRKLNCSPYMFRSCRRAFFSENARNPPNQRNSVILRFQKKKKTEVAWKWGINGPCGKLKITNTEDDQVDLTPGDIPGAGFSEEKIEKLTVAQLKLVKMPPYKCQW